MDINKELIESFISDKSKQDTDINLHNYKEGLIDMYMYLSLSQPTTDLDANYKYEVPDNFGKNVKLFYKKRETDLDELIAAAKYGYEFRDTTSFPEHKFEDSCINNFKQLLQSKGLISMHLQSPAVKESLTSESDAVEFAEWLSKEQYNRISKHDGIVYWAKIDNYHYTQTTEQLHHLFKQSKP